jgi:hypothetical protein
MPVSGHKPLLPPNIHPFHALPVLCGYVGARFGDWTYRGVQFVRTARPSIAVDPLPERAAVFNGDDLHPGNVAFANLPRGHKFLAHACVFGLHRKQLLAELFVDQARFYPAELQY